MIEPRLYRVAFLPAALAAVVAAFSLQERPAGRVAEAAADVLFDGAAAASQAREIAERFPQRAPGSSGDHGAAELVSSELSLRGFDVAADRFSSGGEQLVNVVATRSGASRDRIVVMAPRAATRSQDLGGTASDTAALLQLATALEGQATPLTVVMVSYDGAEAGVERFIETAEDRERLRYVVVLSNLGAPPPARPGLVGWSQNLRLESIGLARTAAEALRREAPTTEPPPGLGDQLAHLVFPIGIGAQGILLAAGYSTIRFSGSGLLPPSGSSAELDADRLGALGKAVLQTLAAVDDGPPLEHGPGTYLTAGRVVIPAWSISLLALALILPALVAAIDAAARARRLQRAILPWGFWLARIVAAFAAAAILALLLGLAGVGPDRAGSPPLPSEQPFGPGPVVALVIVAAALAGVWLALRPLERLQALALEDRDVRGGGVVTSLALAALALAVWLPAVGLGNPYAALALVVPLHLWMLATLGPGSLAAWVRIALYVAGLIPVLLVVVHYLIELGLDPVSGAWYLLQLIAGGAVDLRATLALAVFGAVAVATLALVVVQIRARRPQLVAVPQA